MLFWSNGETEKVYFWGERTDFSLWFKDAKTDLDSRSRFAYVNKQRHLQKWCFRIEYHLQNCLFSVKSTDIRLLITLNKEIVCNEWIWFCYEAFLTIISTGPPVRPPSWIPGVAMVISLIDRSTSRALVCEKSCSSTRSFPSPRRTLKLSQKQGRPLRHN